MNEKLIKKQYLKKISDLRKHNQAYYDKSAPLIADTDYDKLKKDIFLYVDVDVDECVDLYAFLKKSKRINGIPAIFLYSKEITKNMDDDYIYIPHASVSGTKERDIQKLFDLIQ